MTDFNFTRRRLRKFDAPERKIEIWCHKHFDPVFLSRGTVNPINGMAANEFLLRRFQHDIADSPTYKRDIADGMTDKQAMNKALFNLVPICCLYSDDIPELLERCRFASLAISHPEMNQADDPEGRYPIYFS